MEIITFYSVRNIRHTNETTLNSKLPYKMINNDVKHCVQMKPVQSLRPLTCNQKGSCKTWESASCDRLEAHLKDECGVPTSASYIIGSWAFEMMTSIWRPSTGVPLLIQGFIYLSWVYVSKRLQTSIHIFTAFIIHLSKGHLRLLYFKCPHDDYFGSASMSSSAHNEHRRNTITFSLTYSFKSVSSGKFISLDEEKQSWPRPNLPYFPYISIC